MILEAVQWISAFFAIVGSLGVLRFNEPYLRVHANTICTVGGTMLLLLTLAVQTGSPKYVLLVLFLAVSSPTASHIIANAAYVSGIKPRDSLALLGEKDV